MGIEDVVARLGGRVGTSGTSRKTADVPVNPLPHKAGTLGTSGTPKNNDGEVQNLNAPASHWRVTFPDRQLLTAHLAPPATLGEVLAIYPDATSAEPAPAPEPGKLSQEEAAELAHLLAAIFPDPIDRAEATEAAARDPVGALRCWRAIATERAGWSEDDVEAFEERAAVAEYDGALPRQEAEALAMQEAQQREGCGCAHTSSSRACRRATAAVDVKICLAHTACITRCASYLPTRARAAPATDRTRADTMQNRHREARQA